jgi:diguanylate cyclase (GGDEF)-like protein
VRKCHELADPDDINAIETLLIADRVLSEVRANGSFAMTFRLVLDEAPTYVCLRAAMVEERDGHRLIMGLSNVDAQVRRDMEYALAQNLANKDALTGVKNKHAYDEAEAQLNARIEADEDVAFGVVVCDLNDLKRTNDTLGHQAGDQLLRSACHIVCTVFKHSPVFRVGGDEFAAIVQGHDLEHLDELCSELARIDEEHLRTGEAVVAWGVSTYQGDADVAAVFARADAAMYENKRMLKQAR